jgi:hypothetical protein
VAMRGTVYRGLGFGGTGTGGTGRAEKTIRGCTPALAVMPHSVYSLGLCDDCR